jgi:hypothetical protein
MLIVEMVEESKKRVCDLLPHEQKRVHFAAAVIGAPDILVLDECTAYQNYSVRRSMYYIMHMLKQRGHAIFVGASRLFPIPFFILSGVGITCFSSCCDKDSAISFTACPRDFILEIRHQFYTSILLAI